jgi:bifunctional DNase/RNase
MQFTSGHPCFPAVERTVIEGLSPLAKGSRSGIISSVMKIRRALIHFLMPALCMLCITAMSCSTKTPFDASLEQVKVAEVLMDRSDASPVVRLESMDGKRGMLLWIGVNEATSIAFELEGKKPPRPLTHDLLKSILDALQVKVEGVIISDLEENTYIARLLLKKSRMRINLDARPSDALALALRFGSPVYAARKLLSENPIPQAGIYDTFSWDEFGFTVQNLSPVMMEYFEMGDLGGVIVSEIDSQSGPYIDGLRQGDVITRIEGQDIDDTADFAAIADDLSDQMQVSVTVIREKQVIDLTLHALVEQ